MTASKVKLWAQSWGLQSVLEHVTIQSLSDIIGAYFEIFQPNTCPIVSNVQPLFVQTKSVGRHFPIWHFLLFNLHCNQSRQWDSQSVCRDFIFQAPCLRLNSFEMFAILFQDFSSHGGIVGRSSPAIVLRVLTLYRQVEWDFNCSTFLANIF